MCDSGTVDETSTWEQIGERLREARESIGLTQGELAERIGLERTQVVKIEGGQRHLNAMELYRISDTLGVPFAHFVAPPPVAVMSRRSEPADESDSGRLKRFRLDVALETQARDTLWLVENRVLAPPTLAATAESDPLRLARQVRAALGQSSGPLGPLAEVAERLGLYLTVVDVDGDGASVLLDGYGAAVVGHVRRDPGRRRWTAAHEIGHHLLRDEYTTDVGGVASSREDREGVINTFAGEFLLPAADLASSLDGAGEDEFRARLVRVAAEYRLSWSAVVNRSRQSELIPERLARRLRDEVPVRGDFLAVVGWEPEPDLEFGERGPQWRQAVLAAYQDALITGRRAVELLGTDLEVEDLPDRPNLEEVW